jgi:LmbE family N-acetylglucosaminyl deacetylase
VTASSISDAGRSFADRERKLISLTQEELFRRATAPEGHPRPVPRTLLVFAHPDDETVALGARLGRFGNAHFVHVTDGAPRNEEDSRRHGFRSWREYRAARAQEFANLLKAAGIGGAGHECLDAPDQEASLQMAALTRRVAELLRAHKPEVLFTHPFEGGHPDHDACAFVVHHAVQRIDSPPIVIESAFYNAGAPGPGSFLPRPENLAHQEYQLTPEEKRRKQERLDCFVSQRETLHGFPLEWERFRIAPAYDFARPPHPPPLLYDRYPWGMTSERFSQLAREAEALFDDER